MKNLGRVLAAIGLLAVPAAAWASGAAAKLASCCSSCPFCR
jgi:hypothetical protein